METRRIRRLERRRARRIVVAISALAAIGLAVGLALPRSTLASAVILAVAVPSLVVIALRGEACAPTHGLHGVVRLPMHSAISATLESFWSRVVGTIRGIMRRAPRPIVVPLDGEDDDAEQWWGSSRELLTTTPVTSTADDEDAPTGPRHAERLRACLQRQLVGTRRIFTRRMGESHVAGDSTSGDAAEAGTLSARST